MPDTINPYSSADTPDSSPGYNADKLDGADLTIESPLPSSDLLIPSAKAVITHIARVIGEYLKYKLGVDKLSADVPLADSDDCIPTAKAVRRHVSAVIAGGVGGKYCVGTMYPKYQNNLLLSKPRLRATINSSLFTEISFDDFRYTVAGQVVYDDALTPMLPDRFIIPAGKFCCFAIYKDQVYGRFLRSDLVLGNSYSEVYNARLTVLPGVILGWCIVQARNDRAFESNNQNSNYIPGSGCVGCWFIDALVAPDLDVRCGFRPKIVEVWNDDNQTFIKWDESFAPGSGIADKFAYGQVLTLPFWFGNYPVWFDGIIIAGFEYWQNYQKKISVSEFLNLSFNQIVVAPGKWQSVWFYLDRNGAVARRYGRSEGYSSENEAKDAIVKPVGTELVPLTLTTLKGLPNKTWTGGTDKFLDGQFEVLRINKPSLANPLAGSGITVDDGGFKLGYHVPIHAASGALRYKVWG